MAASRALAAAAALLALPALAPAQPAGLCAGCHPAEVEQYLLSGMGRSISPPSPEHPAGMYRHGLSGTTFNTSATDHGLAQSIERDGLGADYAIDYVIGSGNAAFGYLVLVGDAMFQSPVTYYTERGQWGMAPGMERAEHPDFTRPVTAECLWCHAGRPAPIPNTVNRYLHPHFELGAISCDRCHGPVERHLRRPVRSTIFNPARALPRERDSVCEQCHLGGAIRVLNPGHDFGSFQPGDRLEDHWTVFVGAQSGPGQQGRFQVVSHVEQLSLSRCAQLSGRQFWCGTCHNPHQTPADPKPHFSQRCLGCHEPGLTADHLEHEADCISCHMPRRQSHDSGHSAFTDHRITRHPLPAAAPRPPDELRPWRQGPRHLRERNLGIAYIHYAQQHGSPEFLRRGLRLLDRPDRDLEHDPATLEALGTAMILDGATSLGHRRLLRAHTLEPLNALLLNSLAAAWWEMEEDWEAEATLHEAIELEPTLESSYRLLARIYGDLGQRRNVERTWRRYLSERPRHIEARQRVR